MAARISLLAACAVGLSVAVASLAAYLTLRDQLYQRLDESLLERAQTSSDAGFVTAAAIRNLPSYVLGAADVKIYLILSDGTVLPTQRAAWLGRPSTEELRVARGALDHTFRNMERSGSDYRAVTVPAERGAALMFVQSQEPIVSTLDRMGLVLLIVGIGGIAAAALIGLVVARSALQPVRRLSAAARHIAATEELQPIAVTGDDELASLASSFNDMLTALGASRERQRQLVVDAGHELRTPLTSLRTNLELLALADRRGGMPAEQRDEIFDDATAQVEELSTLVGDLVELARDVPLDRAPEAVDFADVVTRAGDRVRRRAVGLSLDIALQPWWVIGEAQILERAVTNLLDNAAKWSPAGAKVTVRLEDGVLTVADEGPGVNAGDLDMIFERFYRAPEARAMPGSGLGLSIVKQAAQRHGGTVSAINRSPHGAVLTLTLPGHSDDPGPVRSDDRRPQRSS